MVDVGTAFLNADNDERILMLLRGKLAEMMVRIDPVLYRQYVTYSKNGIPMLCVRLTKALYGMLRAALLFYKKLRGDLELTGFEVNPYDPCVANMQVDGSQLTVCWHVDDLKISHKSELVVTGFVAKLGQMYGGKLTFSRGKVHDYLGMDLDFSSEPGAMIISMIKYLQKVIDEFPEVLHGTKACPAGKHLSDIRPDKVRELLPKEWRVNVIVLLPNCFFYV